jgi:hypothetical protein
MVCQLDQNDYCSRHKRKHVGGEKQWALNPSPKGEAYRRLWDRMLKEVGPSTARPFRRNTNAPKKPCGCKTPNGS